MMNLPRQNADEFLKNIELHEQWLSTRHSGASSLGRQLSMSQQYVSDCVINGRMLVAVQFIRCFFENVEFINCNFGAVMMPLITCINCKFNDCGLYKSDLIVGTYVACEFKNSNLAKAELNQSVFSHCDFSDADLRQASLRNTCLRFSAFNAVDFREARLSDTEFHITESYKTKSIEGIVLKNISITTSSMAFEPLSDEAAAEKLFS